MTGNKGPRTCLCALLTAFFVLVSCGKKGPPLVPVKLKETVISYFTIRPYRGLALLYWGEKTILEEKSRRQWLGYRIFRREIDGSTLELETITLRDGVKDYRYVDGKVEGDKVYSYAIQLLTDDGRVVSLSPEVSFKAGRGPVYPDQLRVEGGDGQVLISWSLSRPGMREGEEFLGYNIFRRTRSEKYDLSRPLNLELLTTGRFPDTGVKNEREYCYSLTSVVLKEGFIEEGELSSEYCSIPRDSTPPAVPDGLNYSRGSGFLLLSWQENRDSDLAGYRVYRREGAEGSFILQTESILTTPVFKDQNVRSKSIYSYTVTAVDSSPAANESPFSEIIEIIIP